MKKILLNCLAIIFFYTVSYSQNTSEKFISSDSKEKVQIGGYGQIDFNQKLSSDSYYNGNLDVHRLVLLFGYRFNEKVNFITELEFEHVKEVYVEQAFLNVQIADGLNFRGGLVLIPMGIINEYHEPATFNGVERPNVDKNIVPTTWREIGAGFTGTLSSASLKYQLYIVNGFNGYNGSGTFRGSDAFRKGRQKGAESFTSSPNFSAKVDYYGISGLKVGISGYFGNSQSSLYNGLDKNDQIGIAKADSSVVGISMIGLDGRFNKNGLELKGQVIYSSVKNTNEYNAFTGSDLGSMVNGWYLEAGYDLFALTNKSEPGKLVPFVRYEDYNTHAKTTGSLEKNKAYHRNETTVGIGWWLATGAVLKADMQWFNNSASDKAISQLNLGLGIWF